MKNQQAKIARLREALELIVKWDQREKLTCIDVDPAGNTYAVEYVDGRCAEIARAALAEED